MLLRLWGKPTEQMGKGGYDCKGYIHQRHDAAGLIQRERVPRES